MKSSRVGRKTPNKQTNKQEPQENPKENGLVHSILYVNNLNPTSPKTRQQQKREPFFFFFYMFCTQNVLDSTAWVANFIVHLCTTERGAAKCVIALRINNAISLLDAYQYWSKVKLS